MSTIRWPAGDACIAERLAITAELAQHVILQLSERLRQFREGGAIPQSAGLTLNDRQIVMPVVDRAGRLIVRPLDDPVMFADDLAFGDDHQPFRVDVQTDGAIGERGRNAVSIAIETDQAGGRHTLALLDKAIEGRRQCHQGRLFFGPDIGDRARQNAMRDLAPEFEAALFQPGIQGSQIWKIRRRQPKARPCVLNVLLDLAPSPAVLNRWRHAGSTQPDAGLQN